jgi:hypothetical protein
LLSSFAIFSKGANQCRVCQEVSVRHDLTEYRDYAVTPPGLANAPAGPARRTRRLLCALPDVGGDVACNTLPYKIAALREAHL